MFLRRHDSGVALKSKAALTALRKEDPALAKELDDMMVKAAIATVYHLVRTSPLAWLTFCVLLGTGMYKLIREVFEKVALEESQDMKLKPAACA
jgi:hypothetical protein